MRIGRRHKELVVNLLKMPFSTTNLTNLTNLTSNGTIARLNPQNSLVFLVLEEIFFVVTVYLIVSISHFAWEEINKPRGLGGYATDRKHKLLFGLMMLFTITCAGKYSYAVWVYYVPQPLVTLHHCAMVTVIYQFMNTINTVTLYLFLWLRQFTLYQEPHLNYLVKPCVNKFSHVLLGVIVVGGIGALVGLSQSIDEDEYYVVKGTNACSYSAVLTGINAVIVYGGYAVVIIMQGCVLSLFLYILLLYQRAVETPDLNTKCRGKIASVRISRLVRNCAVAAVVSTLSDIAVVVLVSLLRSNATQMTLHTIPDIDSIINLACIIFCFSNWKQLIWPWTCFKFKFSDISSLSWFRSVTK